MILNHQDLWGPLQLISVAFLLKMLSSCDHLKLVYLRVAMFYGCVLCIEIYPTLSWYITAPCLLYQELEEKRKEKAKVAYERRKQLAKLRVKAEKTAEEKLASQLEILAPIKYWEAVLSCLISFVEHLVHCFK